MKKLVDKDVDLVWNIYSTKEIVKKYKKDTKFIDITNQLNSWVSENIDYFITSLYLSSLGNFICDKLITTYHLNINKAQNMYLLLAYDDNNLIGVVILSDKEHDISDDFKLNDSKNNLIIDYIIVNPEYQNMGIGTRMIKSIQANQKVLGKSTEGITTVIDNENTHSQRAFLKNNFQIVIPHSHICPYFSKYYYTSRIPDKNKEL